MSLLIAFILVATTLFYPCNTNTVSASVEEGIDMDALKAQDDAFIGYFSIQDVDINVPTYRMDYNWENASIIAQSYADRDNLAVWMYGWTPYMTIADHIHQDFARLSEVKVGTIATIYWYDGTITNYRCIETSLGINDNYDLNDEDGVSWQDWDCDLATYTCEHSIPDGIFIAKWRLE